jgi:hypothetical protein
MAEYTYSQLHEKITEIDALIFRADTGQISLTWEQYTSLKEDAETLMKLLAEGIAESGGHTYAEAYAARQKVRDLDLIAATTKLHRELHPEANPENDAIVAAAFDESSSKESRDEAFGKFLAIFEYLFVNAPRPPVEAPRKGFVRRLFRR